MKGWPISTKQREDLRAGKVLAVLDVDNPRYQQVLDLAYAEDLNEETARRLLANPFPCFLGRITRPRNGEARFLHLGVSVPWETRVIVAQEDYNDGKEIEYTVATRDGSIVFRNNVVQRRPDDGETLFEALVCKNIMLLTPNRVLLRPANQQSGQ